MATELLAPAGGLEAGLAAFQYGADAVYLGLSRFSARADAANFTPEQLDALVGYAHSLTPRRRVFVTVNTLVVQRELPELCETLGVISDIGADAVIVQDLGVLRLCRRHFPELELHASTQLAAHDRAGVETLAKLGFKRVTLARELTLDEIRDCASVPGTEVETFLHGALCYSYSGLCLFSSQLLGRSGNRGTCAYPCRDRWRVEAHCGAELPADKQSGFAFSMKDLALGEHVPGLVQAGVACLKIEGRKKSPLYVATTVDYYRRLLDGTLRPAERAAREEDLKAVFSRPWTSLYLKSHRDKDVADRDFVGHRGARIGTVETVVKVGKSVSVRFKTTRGLARHDGLQIDVPGRDRPFGFGVDDLFLLPDSPRGRAESVVLAPAGSRVDVPLPDDYPTIPAGAAIYCSSSQDVKQRFRVDNPNVGSFRKRLALRLTARLDAARLKVTARVKERGIDVEQELAGPFDAAKDPGKMAAAARGAFEKLGDSRFALQDLAWENPAGLFVPVSRLNELRRGLVEALTAKVFEQASARVTRAKGEASASVAATPADELRWSVKTDRLATLEGFTAEDFEDVEEIVYDVALEPLSTMVEQVRSIEARSGRPVRLALPLVARAWEDKALMAKIAALRAAGFSRWEAGNVSAWTRLGLPDPAIDLAADWSLYVVNRMAAEHLAELGARRFVCSPEDGLENLRGLFAEYGVRATVIVHQDTPLFISESCPYANLRDGCPGPAKCTYERMDLVSSYGGKVLALNERCRTFVVNALPFCLSDRLEALRDAGARSLRVDFVHRPYLPTQAVDVWRRLRRGSHVPGHRGNFDRGLAAG